MGMNIWPLSPRRIARPLFVGDGAFSDNVKYALLFYLRRYGLNSASYMTHDPATHTALSEHGLPSILWDGIENGDAVDAVLAASVIVCDTHLLPHGGYGPEFQRFAQGTPSINLWHGIPIKDIGRRYRVYDRVIESNLLVDSYRPWHFLIPSNRTLSIFSDYYPKSRFHSARYPRNLSWDYPDLKGRQINVDSSMLAHLTDDAEQKIMRVMFCPTFRDRQTNLVVHYGLAELDPLLKKAGIRLYVKFHHYDHASVLPTEKEFTNIRLVGSYTDIYPLLPHSDALVTDISSVLFDYALLRKPVFLVMPKDPVNTTALRITKASLEFAEDLVRVATLSELVEKLSDSRQETMARGLRATVALRQRVYNRQATSSVDRVSPWINGLGAAANRGRA